MLLPQVGSWNLFYGTDAAVVSLLYGIYFDTLYVAPFMLHLALCMPVLC